MRKYISLAQINKFRNCKFQYFGHYIIGMRDKETKSYFAFGNAIDFFLCTALEQENPNIESLKEQSLINFDIETENIKDTEEYLFFRSSLISALEIAEKNVYKELKGRVKKSQVEFNVEFDNIVIKGIIDLEMNSGDWLIDIKTASKMWSKHKANTETQALLYPIYLFSKNKKLKEVRFDYYIITSAAIPKFDIRSVTVTREMSEQFLNWIVSNNKLIQFCKDDYYKNEDPTIFTNNRSSIYCSKRFCHIWELCEKTFCCKIKD